MIKKVALLIAVSLLSISTITFADDSHGVKCVRPLKAGEQASGLIEGKTPYVLEDSAEACKTNGGTVAE